MTKKMITTSGAPAPIGPYSQAVEAGPFLFLSGQIAIDPASGQLKTETIREETRQVMENIRHILQSAGLRFDHVVKTTIFLTDMGHFAEVNEVYGSYFEKEFPARETVQVSALPRNVNVEISMVAWRG
ncbi:MAG: RidA family protein [Chitinophagaceae bacterium]|nr:RidA family protein [Chitinophagaceae bacterium]